MRSVSEQLRTNEAVDSVFEVTGFSFIGAGESVGMFFIKLKDYDDRKATATRVQPVGLRHGHEPERDGMALFFNLPTIPGLGNFGGFEFWLEDRTGAGRPALYGAHGRAAGQAAQESGGRRRAAERVAAGAATRISRSIASRRSPWGSPSRMSTRPMQLMLAPVYVNDFIFEGRVLRVTMQADAPFRMNEDALQPLLSTGGHHERATALRAVAGDNYVDGMVPLSSVLRSKLVVAAPPRRRASTVLPAIQHQSAARRPGTEFGRGHAGDGAHRARGPAAGFGFDWAGQSLQEQLSGAEAPMLFASVHPRRVPVPGRVVRKLGHAHRGAARGAGGHHRRQSSRPRPPACPTTCSSRSASSPSLVSPPRTPS